MPTSILRLGVGTSEIKDTGAYEIIEMVYLEFGVVLDGKNS